MPGLDLSSLRILLAVADFHDRTALERILRSFGAKQMNVVNNSAKATSEITAVPFDMIFYDWEMVGMDGLAFTRLIRQGRHFSTRRDAMIVGLSGKLTNDHVIAARDVGVDDLIPKPLTADIVTKKVTRNLAHAKPFVISTTYIGPDRRLVTAPFDGSDRRQVVAPTYPCPCVVKYAKAMAKREALSSNTLTKHNGTVVSEITSPDELRKQNMNAREPACEAAPNALRLEDLERVDVSDPSTPSGEGRAPVHPETPPAAPDPAPAAPPPRPQTAETP
ncbi:MAG: response regulator, partial [Magnetospirillum sp. WYHS-4]